MAGPTTSFHACIRRYSFSGASKAFCRKNFRIISYLFRIITSHSALPFFQSHSHLLQKRLCIPFQSFSIFYPDDPYWYPVMKICPKLSPATSFTICSTREASNLSKISSSNNKGVLLLPVFFKNQTEPVSKRSDKFYSAL